MRCHLWHLVVILVLVHCRVTECSSGDIDPMFRSCAWNCFQERECEALGRVSHEVLRSRLIPTFSSTNIGQKVVVRAWNRLLQAHHHYIHPNCMEGCQYECSWNITQARIYAKPDPLPQHKYHGHWVFRRPYDLHEACSSLFSLLNAVPHMVQVAKQLAAISPKGGFGCGWSSAYCLDVWARAYPYVAIITWSASAIYHAHRTTDSHLLDLCTALVLLAYGLLLTVRRVLGPLSSPLHLLSTPGQTPTRPVWLAYAWYAFLAVGTTLLLWRLHAMCIAGTIGYQAHMNVAVPLAGISSGIWIFWALTAYDDRACSEPSSSSAGHGQGEGILFNWVPHGSSRAHRYYMLVFQVCFICAAMMEIFDFPPWFSLLDAHATWHACTVPLGFMWYTFLRRDAAFMAGATVSEEAVHAAERGRSRGKSGPAAAAFALSGKDGSSGFGCLKRSRSGSTKRVRSAKA